MLDGAFMIPYVMPGIVIGIAYIAAFNTGPIVLTAPRRFSCSRSNPPPAVYRPHHRVGPPPDFASMEEAAVSLGYSPLRAFLRITVPLIVPASSPAAC